MAKKKKKISPSVLAAQARDYADKNYPGPKNFFHLHNHTIFSVLDGIATPEQYAELCVQFGFDGFAITDHGSMAGLPDGLIATDKYGVKLIAGVEFYYNEHHIEFRKQQQDKNFKLKELKIKNFELHQRYVRHRHLTVLAKNMVGYETMLKLQSLAYEHGFYRKPRINIEMLKKHNRGLIVLSGCMTGNIFSELLFAKELKGKDNHCYRNLIKWVSSMKEIFGDDFYIETQLPGKSVDGSKMYFRESINIAKSFEIPVVMTCDCHYKYTHENKTQRLMMAVGRRTTLDDPNLWASSSGEQFFKTRSQLRKLFYEDGYSNCGTIEDFEKMCDNTCIVSEKCDHFEPDCKLKLPQVDNADEKLIKMAWRSLKKKGLHRVNKRYVVDGHEVTYIDQLIVELKRIVEKGFSSYFLITGELMATIKKEYGKEVIGPGRGSAGGCLVAYLLDITEINPLQFQLSFERFMTQSRGGYQLKVSMDD